MGQEDTEIVQKWAEKIQKLSKNIKNGKHLGNYEILVRRTRERSVLIVSTSSARCSVRAEMQRRGRNTYHLRFLYTTLCLMPSIFSFFLCWFFKGDINHSLMIHQSWQSLSEITPSISALYEKEPTGAIAAIGWGTSQVFTSSLLSQFNLFIFWHPGMWFLTIHIAMRLFIGKKKDVNQKLKRTIVCSQLIAFIPMFLFVDIGRWIFMLSLIHI